MSTYLSLSSLLTCASIDQILVRYSISLFLMSFPFVVGYMCLVSSLSCLVMLLMAIGPWIVLDCRPRAVLYISVEEGREGRVSARVATYRSHFLLYCKFSTLRNTKETLANFSK